MSMAKMIQVRNVPDRLHRELKRRARLRGQSLTGYIEEILERELARPPREEVFERVRRSEPVDLAPGTIARWIREERAERERRL
jgi:plasmid stability protein